MKSSSLTTPDLEGPGPPVIHISREVRQSEKANEAYNKALDEHGPVVIVPRHGRNEYIIDHAHAYDVLTDSKHFKFDKAVFDMLHLGFIALFDDNGTYVHDVDNIVATGVQPRMDGIIDQVFLVFRAYFERMEDEIPAGQSSGVDDDKSGIEMSDIFSRIQLAVAHAMVVLILGLTHSSSATAGHFAAVAVAMADMTGMHENTHEWTWAPGLWVFWTALRAIFGTIIPRFFLPVVPVLWRTRAEHLTNGLAATDHHQHGGEFVPLFDALLVKNYHGKTGIRALLGFGWCLTLCVGLIFASVHQTVVAAFWVLVMLSQKQDEYLLSMREEWDEVAPFGEDLTAKRLSEFKLLDSFIREVMRTKNDTFAPIRQTTRPVRVGPYVLPKDAVCMPLVTRAHQHLDIHGPDGNVFDGFQWQRKGRPAVQGNAGYLAFGLGRWACPGRQLAIHEIKIVIYLLFSKFDIRLKGNTYKVTNPMNTTSVPPEASFLVRRRMRK